MSDSQTPTAASVPIAVVCDRCRAHVNNWTAEHQRAFIAALAMTGSPRQAARILGRHMFGAQQLRTARGGRSFSAAWDAALEVARDREFARIHANLSDLSERQSAADAQSPALATSAASRWSDGGGDDDMDGDRRDYLDARVRVRDRLTRARRLLLFFLSEDPAKRAAREVLVGPVDWDRASRTESQADEPFADPQFESYEGYDVNPHNLTKPDMLLVAEAGLIPDITGGRDAMAEMTAEIEGLDLAEGEEG